MDISKIKLDCDGVAVHGFNPRAATQDQVEDLKKLIYKEKIVVLKNQDINDSEFVEFGKKIGRIREYYEKMYHHPKHKEIFVSSNVNEDGTTVGVPHTGKFWHSDYAFMAEPFAFTMLYPQVVPKKNRGTHYIDMAEAYKKLPDRYKCALEGVTAEHTVRSYFKIRPQDVYRPISAIIEEVNLKTPPVIHNAVTTHPVTGEKILYVSQGFTTQLNGENNGLDYDKLLHELLDLTGQFDDNFTHPNIQLVEIEKGDIILWDNRRYVHHAKHAKVVEPSVNYRLTIYDEFPFDACETELKETAEA